ncbi:calcium-binding protein [Thalassobius vesicularis]|nr:calcium-binding protein [Thalassobius vesicularis]
MLITYTGSDNVFFGTAFFGPFGQDVTLLSGTSTQIVVQQPDTGVITVATGTGFTFDGTGQPTGGTVTGFSMSLNGTVQTTITDISWNLVAFISALDEIDQNENYAPMGALFSASPIVVDASTATGGFDFSDIADLSPFITATITITGSSHDDTLMGGAANDTINAGANDGNDLIGGSGGNDVYDFGDADSNSYYTLTYEMQTGPIVVTLDGVAGQGTVTGSGTDTLNNINAAMTASDGGLAIVGTGSNDTFNVTTTGTQWASVVGGAGNDTFNLTLGSGMRVDFRSIVEMGATQGLIMDLSTGVVSNDGFGGTDQINVTGSGRLEIRATNNTDQITGSSRNESFILELGNDTLDAGAGFDRLRYDRGGVEYVTVDLSTGLISGVWYGSAFIHTVSGVEWVRGSRTGNDQLIGDGNANRLEGMGGNDTLNGMGGGDTLIGGDGNDLIIGNDFDNIWAGGGDDTIDLSAVTGAGWVFISYSDVTAPVIFNIDGTANTGSVTGAGSDTIININNALYGDGLDTEGTDGDDTFNVTLAAGQWMSMHGRDGVDTYNIAGSGSVRLNFRGGNGADVDLSSGTVNDDGFGNVEVINGTVWELRGSNADDTFTGSANNESFILEGGNDVLDGGLGFDRLRFDRSGMSAVVVNLLAGTATGSFNGSSFSHSITGIEWVRGTGFADEITGNNDGNRLEGRGGNDTLYGLGGNDTLTTRDGWGVLYGGDGDDVLTADQWGDMLNGGAGHDTLDAGGGDDELWGMAGDDSMLGGAGNDRLGGGDGNDTLIGDTGLDTAFGGNGNDVLNGGDGNDQLWGDGDNDTLYGGLGNDTLGGGTGDDQLWGNDGADTLYGGAGNDQLGGGTGNDELWGADGGDTLFGGDGIDTLGGGTGYDQLWGDAGDDLIYGGLGNDTIGGGDGNDELWGGDQNDTIYGGLGDDLLGGGTGNDELWGGSGQNTIYAGQGNDTLGGGVDDDELWGGAGDDLFYAGGGNDTVAGEAGNDSLYGGLGDDTLIGGEGDDVMTGGGGADRFVFRTGFGNDVATDFSLAQSDELALDDALWASYGTLTAAQVIAQFGSVSGGNVVFTFDGGEVITLNGLGSLAGLDSHIVII